MKKLTALMLTLAMILALAACTAQEPDAPAADDKTTGTDTQNPTVTPDPAPTPDPVPTPDPAPVVDNEVVEYYMSKADTVKVTDTHVIVTDDGSGTEVSLAKNPKKVAVLYGSLACLWYEAGGTIQLAVGGKSAITTYEEQIGRDFTQDEGVTVVTTSSSGTGWDVEKILAEKPDLIVTSTGMKGYSTISGPAAAVGIPCIGINYDAVQDYLKWFKVFCNLNGQPELWDSVAEKTANEIIDIVSKAPKMDQPPTTLIMLVSSNKLRVYTADSQPGVMVKELGGKNLADPNNEGASTYLEVSMEDVYAMNPDIIFISDGATGADVVLETVKASPIWESLNAVKNNKVFVLEKGLFHNKANHRYNESYKTMAQYLYPDTDF